MIPKFLLPERYRESFVIAGGWAACPVMASDADVWVQVHGSLVGARDAILAHLSVMLNDDEWEEESDGRIALEEAAETYGEGSLGLVLKVAKVQLTGYEYHILVTGMSTHELLDTFDISTHQIALTWNGGIVKGTNWTPITYSPVILKMTPTTPARYRKICARYNHQPVEIKEAA